MRIALLEPFSGVAGDMFVGALVHAGAPADGIAALPARLGLEGVTARWEEARRGSLAAGRFRVGATGAQPQRDLADILALLERADLPAGVLARSTAAFRALGAAEAEVHGVPVERVHFHEVGAADAIVDVTAAAWALEQLGIERLFCGTLPLGDGAVDTAHGRLPVPAPATLALLRGRPVRAGGGESELVTPTGAALVAAWAAEGPPPPFRPLAIGYGAGTRDPADRPNVCRVTVGDVVGERAGSLVELACEIDDATPEQLAWLHARLLESGARDATLQSVTMKKGRPGVRVGVLAEAALVPVMEELLFAEGGTLGVRRHAVERTELARRAVDVTTPWGTVRVKLGERGGRVVVAAPEYEDCARIAREAGVPLREVMQAAMAQWRG